MSLLLRLAVVTGILTLPAVVLAAALLGPRPRRWLKATVLGAVAGTPAVAAITAAGNRHPHAHLPVMTIVVALVPGYLVAGVLAVRELSRASSDWWAEHRIDEHVDPLAEVAPLAARPVIAAGSASRPRATNGASAHTGHEPLAS